VTILDGHDSQIYFLSINDDQASMNKKKAEACALSFIDFRLVDVTVTKLEAGCKAHFDYTTLP